VVGGRLEVRPRWADASAPGLPQLELSDGDAFGTGTHPTTVLCLELIAAREPAATFADLGCGTGVLALAAAKLGWERVIAVDSQQQAVDAARENARLNAVELEAEALDLTAGPAPACVLAVANVPPEVHVSLAPHVEAGAVIASGFGHSDVEAVLAAYAAAGFEHSGGRELGGWLALELRSR
jgi:ribosomal protein L11 methyltransferase